MSRRLNILFSGMIAADPHQGGATWAVLQYLLGFRRLGHDVYFVEPVPARSLRPEGVSLKDSVNAKYFMQVVSRFNFRGRAALIMPCTRQTAGMSYEQVQEVADRADVLFNVSGMLVTGGARRRAYLDLDPAFVQLWHSSQGVDMRLDDHTHFVTVGLNIGRPGCDVPTCGRQWIHTLPPVVLEQWSPAGDVRYKRLTTVANWRGYGSIEHNGVHYGQKAHSLRKLIELPKMTRERFTVALNIHKDETRDLEALNRNGWNLLDPAEVAGNPDRYRDFVRSSKAEFGLAKSGYVNSRCGWFSDRSACYLASGRPVVAQDTGWSEHLATGKGLLAFNSAEDVVAAVDEINSDYARHSAAAAQIAREYFDSDVVLSRLLEAVGAG
ncbi:MAG TPA: hypothetical protein VFB66_11080 [Tepidisphaeraceae bacterium]|nr:hypothetical protein [Tepidisphaeraceae bacterium]